MANLLTRANLAADSAQDEIKAGAVTKLKVAELNNTLLRPLACRPMRQDCWALDFKLFHIK